jgi:hypothetical protein
MIDASFLPADKTFLLGPLGEVMVHVQLVVLRVC